MANFGFAVACGRGLIERLWLEDFPFSCDQLQAEQTG